MNKEYKNIFFALLILAAAAAGYFIGVRGRTPLPIGETPSVSPLAEEIAGASPAVAPPAVTAKPRAAATPSPKALVYRNAAYGFELRYSPPVIYREHKERADAKDPHGFTDTLVAWFGYQGLKEESGMRVIIREHDAYTALSDYRSIVLTSIRPGYKLYSVENVAITGQTALKIVEEWEGSPYGRVQTYVFERAGKYLLFSFPAVGVNTKTFDSIVQTILFSR